VRRRPLRHLKRSCSQYSLCCPPPGRPGLLSPGRRATRLYTGSSCTTAPPACPSASRRARGWASDSSARREGALAVELLRVGHYPTTGTRPRHTRSRRPGSGRSGSTAATTARDSRELRASRELWPRDRPAIPLRAPQLLSREEHQRAGCGWLCPETARVSAVRGVISATGVPAQRHSRRASGRTARVSSRAGR
jgi:hypothetical protein